jgi:CRP-like cAMP-binding protein
LNCTAGFQFIMDSCLTPLIWLCKNNGVARKVVEFPRSRKIYSQGEPATGVMYIQDGGVKLSVVNEVGKEAVVAILGPSDFLGEGCLAGQEFPMGTATAIAPTVKRRPARINTAI